MFCKTASVFLHFAVWMTGMRPSVFPQCVNNLSSGSKDLSTIVHRYKDFSKTLAAIAFWPFSCYNDFKLSTTIFKFSTPSIHSVENWRILGERPKFHVTLNRGA